MSTEQNMNQPSQPSRGRRAVLTGGALSLAAVAGGALVRSPSADASVTTQPVVAILPSGDQTGATDVMNINAAFSALPQVYDPDTTQTYSVGSVLLAPCQPTVSPLNTGNFYINATLNKPPKADLIGAGPGTAIFVVGEGATTAISSHHGATSGPDQHATKSGTIANLTIDGSSAGAGAIGIDIGDGWGHQLDHVFINNFSKAGSIGLNVCNRYFYTSEFVARNVILVNNDTAVQHGLDYSTTSANSQEYQDVEYNIWAQPDQNGIIVQGVTWNGSMRVRGNFLKDTVTGYSVLTLQVDTPSGYNATMKGSFDISVEIDTDGGNPANPYSINFADPNQGPFVGVGYLRFTGGHSNPMPPALGKFQFRGIVIESNTSFQAVNTPTAAIVSGTAVPNQGNDANVYITGGPTTVTQVAINGTAINGLTIAPGQLVPVFLPANGTISLTFTGSTSPTWQWVNAL